MLNFRKFKTGHYFITSFIIFLMVYFYNTNNILRRSNTQEKHVKRFSSNNPLQKTSAEKDSLLKITTSEYPSNTKYKYILLWTNPKTSPFKYLKEGNTVFKERKCKYTNCYVTSDREFLGEYTNFDVIAFNGPELLNIIGRDDIPKYRSVRQKYVYANIEAAAAYPICSTTWDQFFNWTWTYKLNSDAIWGYYLIKNTSNHVVAPSMDIDWIDKNEMEPIDEDTKAKLAGKKKPVAWFVSNCVTQSAREEYVEQIRSDMRNFYNLYVDIYGDCGDLACPKKIMGECLNALQRNYYFYLAFENALSEDYVTEKVLHALNHYTVPIVYGGANYSRFLPPGSYINAVDFEPKYLVKTIREAIKHPHIYQNFFRWRRYYTLHKREESPATDDYCQFCAMINNKKLMEKSYAYENFSGWWSSDTKCGEIKPQPNIMTNKKVIFIPG